MISLLNRVPLRTKLALLMLVPLSGMVFFAVSTVGSRFDQAADAEVETLLVELGVRAGDLLHETQKERGASALYLSSGGERFVEELPAQQLTTDGPRQALLDFVAQHGDRLPVDAIESLDPALADLDLLDGQRQRVLDQDGPTGEFIGWYTTMNGHLLSAIAALPRQGSTAEVATDAAAYVAFLNAKERTGLERAQLSSAFATNEFAPGQYATVVQLVSAKEAYLGLFESLAAPDVLAAHLERADAPSVIETTRLETLAIDNLGGGFDVDPTEWFATITERINLLKEVEDFQAERLLARSQVVAAEASSAATSSIVVAAALLLVTVAIGGATLVSLVTQLRSIARAASRIAQGDLSVEPIEVASNDDLGRLSLAFNTMTESLVDLIGGLQRSSAALLSSSSELEGVSSTIATSASATSDRVESTREASGEMALEVSSVAAAVEEMYQTIEEIANNTNRGLAVTEQAVEIIARTTGTIDELGATSTEVGEVIELINGIAAQTNLLALNATIEAARAGVEGQGFAVVANEVKQLATQTSDATDQINDRIGAIQREVGQAVEDSGAVAETIAQINEISASIAAAVEEQTVTLGEISKMFSQVNTGATTLSEAMADMASVSEQSRVAGEQSQHASMSLGALSAELDELAGGFRLGSKQADTELV